MCLKKKTFQSQEYLKSRAEGRGAEIYQCHGGRGWGSRGQDQKKDSGFSEGTCGVWNSSDT